MYLWIIWKMYKSEHENKLLLIISSFSDNQCLHYKIFLSHLLLLCKFIFIFMVLN